MKISFSKPTTAKDGVLAVFAYKGAKLTASAQSIDEATGKQITRAISASRFKGECAEILEILAPSGLVASRLLVVGTGDPGKSAAAEFEQIGGQLYARIAISGETTLNIHLADVGELSLPEGDAAAHIAMGARLRSYRFDQYRTKEPESKKPTLVNIAVLTHEPKAADVVFSALHAVAEGVFFTRDLVSEPANVIYPKSFVKQAQELAKLGVKIEALGEAEMRKLGFGALLGVAQGSMHEPQLLLMEYDGTGEGDKTQPVIFIGKGVTFDTGGISLKPAAGMEAMKWDMGGAGAVAGAMKALAVRQAKCRVIGICALAENMPSGAAQRPGDVVKSYSGQTIEVINTDAEGRLVLCDAMWYAQERYNPKVMIDLATLTGAMIISLGHEYAGIFANDDALATQLVTAGLHSGERLWRLPMGEAYDKLIASPIADMKNVGPREGGSITAAQFLKRFVKEGVAWAHLDIAGMVWAEKDAPLWEKGATGYGVRLLDQFIALYHEQK